MWFKIKSYFSFLLRSTNQHGVHSPFVYDLVTQCFYKKTPSSNINYFKKVKNYLLSNNHIIEVNGNGKGSKIFKTDHRKVAAISIVTGISNKRAVLLIRFVTYFNFEHMLEIGTSVGLGTTAMHIGNPKAVINTLEGCENTADVAKSFFQQFNFNTIKISTGDFKNNLPILLEENQYDFIYFDGNHQKKPMLNYFNQCLQTVHNNSVFILDNIFCSPEIQEAWEEIKNHPKVTVTINTFYWGIVFFRKEQKKQHFTIRV